MSGFSLFLNDLIEWAELKRIPLKAIIELNEYRNFYVRWLCDVAGLECVLLNIKQRWYHPLYNSISPNKILGNIFYQLIAVRISWIFTTIFWMKCDSTDLWFFFPSNGCCYLWKDRTFLISFYKWSTWNGQRCIRYVGIRVCVFFLWVCVCLSFCVVMGDDSSLFPIDGCYQVDARSPC